MYHATMPTDALVQVRAALHATKDFGFEKVGVWGVRGANAGGGTGVGYATLGDAPVRCRQRTRRRNSGWQ